MHSSNLLTPERLISAPRPGIGIANPTGTRALVGSRTFSFEKDCFEEQLYLVDIPSSTNANEYVSYELDVLTTRVSSGFWLSDQIVAFLDPADNSLYAKSIYDKSSKWSCIGSFKVHVKTILVARDSSNIATHLIFSAEVYADGDLEAVKNHDESDAFREWNRVKVYDNTFVRHWDKWMYPGKQTQLFVVDLNSGISISDWSFKESVRNLLKGTTLESPVEPLGTNEDYTVNSSHVAFRSKDPELSPSWHTKQNIYLVPLHGGTSPIKVTKGDHGSTLSPTFSHNGKYLAWLQMDRNGYESDQKKIHIAKFNKEGVLSEERVLLADWTLSPSMIRFAGDDKSLIGIVEQEEHKVLFQVNLDDTSTSDKEGRIIKLAIDGSIEAIHIFERGILVTASSFTGPNDLYLVTPRDDSLSAEPRASRLRLTNFGQSKNSSLANLDFGRKPEQINFPGHRGRTSHGWIHYPPGLDENKKYGLVVLVHGGPAAAWNDSWSTRWNPAVFAARGLFVLTMDPAGSTGFGMAYQEEIRFNWGGAPFDDIVAGTRHTLKHFEDILDPQRVVAAGNSYGGYMMNWIQGHNEDKLFKGLVCHNGIFAMHNVFYSGEELWNTEFEMGGTPWEARQMYDKWSPEQYVDKWETPELLIACGLDFRLPATESLGVFNTLQRRGVPSRLVYFDPENHWVVEPKNSLKWHKEVLGWLLKYSSTKGEDL